MTIGNNSMQIDQSGSHVSGNQIAGDQTININTVHHNSLVRDALAELSKKLAEEKQLDQKIESSVQSLSLYKRRRNAEDGIIGLKAKLEKGERISELEEALEQKILFEELLEAWSYYASAQEIFAHLLASIRRRYKSSVFPHLESLPKHVFDQLVDEKIVEPIVSECGAVREFHVNHDIALGMYYWLAEQCFLRWHK